MDLLKHELYKIFSKKHLHIILVLLLSLVHIPNYVFSSKDIKTNRQVVKYSKPYEGKITDENKKKLFNLTQQYEKKDKNMSDIYNAIYGNYTSQNRKRVVAMSDILKNNNELFYDERLLSKTFEFKGYELDNLKKNLKEEKKLGNENTYDYKNKELASRMYSKLPEPKFFYISAWDSKFSTSYDASLYIMAIVILLGISWGYSNEYKSRVHTIILSSKKGRDECVRAKILAASIYAIFVLSICELTKTFINIKLHGRNALNVPIQCLFDYICSPYNFNVAKLWILSFLTSIIGVLIFVLIILLISDITKSSLITFFIGGSIFIIPILIDSYVVGQFWWKKIIVNLSVSQLMKGDRIYSIFSTTNILGKPVLYPYFALGYGVILIAILTYSLHMRMRAY